MSHVLAGRRVLFVDLRLPVPERDSTSQRIQQILALLRGQGAEVDFLCWREPGAAAPTAALDEIGVRLLPHASGGGATSAEAYLAAAASGYDLICGVWLNLAHHLFGLLRRAAPDCPLLYLGLDATHVLEFREARVTGNARTLQRALRSKQKEREVLEAAALALAITPADAAAYRALAPDATVAVVGMWCTPPARVARRPEPCTLLFLGDLGGPQNHDCAQHLAQDVMPLLRRTLPGSRLLVAGPPHNDIETRIAAPDIEVLGWVADLPGLFARSTAMLATVRFGSGLKGKLLHAMAHEVPIIASTIAVEGTPLVAGEDVLLADTAQETVDAVRRLLAEPALGPRLAGNARAKLERFYCRGAIEAQFAAAMGMLAAGQGQAPA
jgi:hypothetical protein